MSKKDVVERKKLAEHLEHKGNGNYACPVCNDVLHFSVMRQHIVKMSHSEILKKMQGVAVRTPHNDYYMANTTVVTIQKRVWI